MKWVVFLASLVAIVPFADWMRRNPREMPKIWIFVGFLPFAMTAFGSLNVSLISWGQWQGFVKGLQFTALDACIIAIHLALPRSRHQLPFRAALTLYFVAIVFSMSQAPVPMAAGFYAWQFARMALVYAVVARACADERVPFALITGMTIGLAYELYVVIWQRFGMGMVQTAGTFGHQNGLGLVSHFVIFPLFAMLLVGKRGWAVTVGPLSSIIISILTVSRATLGLAGVGLGVLFALSAIRQWTSRKIKIAVLGTIVIGLLTPVALSSYERRFGTEVMEENGYDERAAFTRAASMILSDYPLGIGANNYVVVANGGGYQARAGVTWWGGSRATMVHNVYWLTAVELGYFGLVAFVILLFRLVSTAFICGWRNKFDERGDLLLGLGIALLAVCIHSYFEWAILQFFSQYLLAINAGLIAGLAQQMGYWRVTSPRSVAAPIEAHGLSKR